MIEPDILEHRYLGAIRLIDARTRQKVEGPVSLNGDGVGFIRNRSGLFVIKTAPGFKDYNTGFLAPPLPLPVLKKISLAAIDASGRYLPRQFDIELPREGDDLFKAIDVEMYPAAVMAPPPGAAVLYAKAIDAATALNPEPKGLPWALVDVLEEGTLRVSTLSDLRGEVVVAIPEIPKSSPAGGGGAVLANKTEFDVEIIFDPTVLEKLKTNSRHIVNPDDMRANKAALKQLTMKVTLGAGQIDKKTFSVDIT